MFGNVSTGAGYINMTFDPGRPFNDLPNLPPASETETKAILRSCIAAHTALAELRVSGKLIPNQAMLINSILLLEAQASSEIENIVTTTDRLFRYANDAAGQADPATKEAPALPHRLVPWFRDSEATAGFDRHRCRGLSNDQGCESGYSQQAGNGVEK